MSAVPGLPAAFYKEIEAQLGAQSANFVDALNQPAQRALRCSARRFFNCSAWVRQAVPWAQHAHYLLQDARPGGHPLHWAGAFYLQEPSAMAAVSALAIKPGDKVLDLCAAPGGKASQIADQLLGQGFLLANEPVLARAQVLSRNLERMGLINAVVTSNLPAQLAEALPAYFDKILVDAPCSGEGMFRKNPEVLAAWHPGLPEQLADTQKQILHQAARMLAPGGQMVYSTCTFNATENEGVVNAFLQAHPGFALQPFALPGLPTADQGMLRIWPHQVAGEGHFIALLVHKGEVKGYSCATKPFVNVISKEDSRFLQAVNQLLPDWAINAPPADAVFAGTAVHLPPGCPDLSRLRLLRLGLHLASRQGKTIRSDHALALAAEPRQQLAISLEEAQRFRAGEVLKAPSGLSGYATPVLNGWPLGWGKASAGQLKNHYPKGLRSYQVVDLDES